LDFRFPVILYVSSADGMNIPKSCPLNSFGMRPKKSEIHYASSGDPSKKEKCAKLSVNVSLKGTLRWCFAPRHFGHRVRKKKKLSNETLNHQSAAHSLLFKLITQNGKEN
jgi:hypothetical protein